jgi:hypothetical protein
VYGDAIYDDWGTYQPTLGPTWHHCVSTRLTLRLLQHNPHIINRSFGAGFGGALGDVANENVCDSGNRHAVSKTLMMRGEAQVRCLAITKSPVAAPFELKVFIGPMGIMPFDNPM